MSSIRAYVDGSSVVRYLEGRLVDSKKCNGPKDRTAVGWPCDRDHYRYTCAPCELPLQDFRGTEEFWVDRLGALLWNRSTAASLACGDCSLINVDEGGELLPTSDGSAGR